MCTNPIRLQNGLQVACRECEQCRSNYVTDWVGRCIAESRSSRKTHVVTLTYGRDKTYHEADHANAGILTWNDVQVCLRALRDAGYPLRFFAVGEYGTKKSRAHWHVVIFWQEGIPPIGQMRQNLDWKWWPHGFAMFDDLSPQAVQYACKYIQKDNTDEVGSSNLKMSVRPQLGYEYFRELAHLHVRNYLAPQDLFYTFPESIGKDGTRNRYMMHRATAKYFIRCYLEEWARVHPGENTPWSDLVERYRDSMVEAKVEFEPPMPYRAVKPNKHAMELLPGGWNTRTDYSEKHKAFYVTSKWGGLVRWWTFDEEGKRAWMPQIGNAKENAPNAEERRKSSGEYRTRYGKQSNG